MASSSRKIVQPEADPYEILGLEFPVLDDGVVTKAYRRLALKHHPDKQKDSTNRETAEAAFHALQKARAFLLDAEFADSRIAYDTQRASLQRRAQHDAQQRKARSTARQRQQEELEAAEAAARKRKSGGGSSRSGTTNNKSTKSTSRTEELRQQTQARKEAFAARQAAAAEQEAEPLETRQIRLKWSRKRVKPSPTEESLARQLSAKFGLVQAVEFIGRKGNAALVTFAQASATHTCVDFYQTSPEMRATYVKEPADPKKTTTTTTTEPKESGGATSFETTATARDVESVAAWQARRAAARQAAMQGAVDGESSSASTLSVESFLPRFPISSDAKSPWQQLAALERTILGTSE